MIKNITVAANAAIIKRCEPSFFIDAIARARACRGVNGVMIDELSRTRGAASASKTLFEKNSLLGISSPVRRREMSFLDLPAADERERERERKTGKVMRNTRAP